MTEVVAEEAETSAIEQSFLEMLEREHQWTAVQDRSLSTGQSAEHDPSASAQLCVSSTTDSQEMQEVDLPSQPEVPFARDVAVDACSVQLAGPAAVASAFGGLIHEILISRPELAAAITVFAAVSLVSRLVTDTGRAHQGDLQVLCRYLQEVCSSSSGGV